jgi:hypothetical protein
MVFTTFPSTGFEDEDEYEAAHENVRKRSWKRLGRQRGRER